MFTDEQKAALDRIAEDSMELGIRDQLANDPCDWINAFDYAWSWAKSRHEYERMEKLDALSKRTSAVLDEATSP